MLPITLGVGLINFNLVINTFFASRFVDPELAPSAIDAAFRIYMLPQGIFSVAVATVLFPRLSRLAARNDIAGFRDTVSLGLRQIGFLLLPASAVGAVLAVPIVRLLYQRGAFDADQTQVVAGAFAAFALGLTFNGTMLMLNRAFFSLQSAWVPTAIALGTPRAQRRPERRALPRRRLGHPAGDLDRQHRRHRRAPRRLPQAPRSDRRPCAGSLLRPYQRRRGRRSGSGLRSLVRARRGLRPLARRADRSRWASASSPAAAAYLGLAALLRVRELQTLLSLRRRSATTSEE